MSIGIIGTKSGMTRVFDESGKSIAVSVIAVQPNRVTQIKKDSIDGYDAVQVTTGTVKQNNVSRPMAGHFAKAETTAVYSIINTSVGSPTFANGSWLRMDTEIVSAKTVASLKIRNNSR